MASVRKPQPARKRSTFVEFGQAEKPRVPENAFSATPEDGVNSPEHPEHIPVNPALPPLTSRARRSVSRPRGNSISLQSLRRSSVSSDFVVQVEITKKDIERLAEVYGVGADRVKDVAIAAEGDMDLMKAILESEKEVRQSSPTNQTTLQYSTKDTVKRLMNFLDLPPDWEPEVVRTLNDTKGDAQLAAEKLASKTEQLYGKDGRIKPQNRVRASSQAPLSDAQLKELQNFFVQLDGAGGGGAGGPTSNKAMALMREFPGLELKEVNVALKLTDDNVDHARVFLRENGLDKDKSRIENAFKHVVSNHNLRPTKPKNTEEQNYYKMNGALGVRDSIVNLEKNPDEDDDVLGSSVGPGARRAESTPPQTPTAPSTSKPTTTTRARRYSTASLPSASHTREPSPPPGVAPESHRRPTLSTGLTENDSKGITAMVQANLRSPDKAGGHRSARDRAQSMPGGASPYKEKAAASGGPHYSAPSPPPPTAHTTTVPPSPMTNTGVSVTILNSLPPPPAGLPPPPPVTGTGHYNAGSSGAPATGTGYYGNNTAAGTAGTAGTGYYGNNAATGSTGVPNTGNAGHYGTTTNTAAAGSSGLPPPPAGLPPPPLPPGGLPPPPAPSGLPPPPPPNNNNGLPPPPVGLPPPPLPPGGLPPPAPPSGLPPPTPPGGLPPPAPPAGLPPPAPPGGLPPPAPPPPPMGKGGAPPPPPPPPGGKGGAPPPPPGVKAASRSTTLGPTKNIPLTASMEHSGGVWKDVKKFALSEDIQNDLLNLFPRVAPKATEEQEAKKEQLQILDNKREENVAIVLKFLRLPNSTIEASVRTFDELTLGEEHISGLAKTIPTENDLFAIETAKKRHGGPWTEEEQEQLSEPVKFFMMTTNIDHYAERIKAWHLKNEYFSLVANLKGKLDLAYGGVMAILSSQHLPEMLSYILTLTNFLNTGSRYEGAKGFPISDLMNILNFRFTEGKGILLEYVVEKIEKDQPDIGLFRNELMPAVDKARDVDVPALKVELDELNNRLTLCSKLVQSIPEDKRWNGVLSKFVFKAYPLMEEAQKLHTLLNEKIETLIDFLCEKKRSFSLNEAFRILAVFCKRYDQQVARIAEKEERLARMNAKKEGETGGESDSNDGKSAREEGRKPSTTSTGSTPSNPSPRFAEKPPTHNNKHTTNTNHAHNNNTSHKPTTASTPKATPTTTLPSTSARPASAARYNNNNTTSNNNNSRTPPTSKAPSSASNSARSARPASGAAHTPKKEEIISATGVSPSALDVVRAAGAGKYGRRYSTTNKSEGSKTLPNDIKAIAAQVAREQELRNMGNKKK
ncbi:Formin Homology 2 Domain, putative [Angomonas deanei]|uniref:Formin Homology 2 Domain, putative n=1 Tax=Angomonas deanei TaxID=59799 RepID=A0A7G2CR94_9TRYP|nr:Formin Homology 2 Domain, putative [Angomonas deanei]